MGPGSEAGTTVEIVAHASPHKQASFLRTQEPIRRGLSVERRCLTTSHNPTSCGYGSLRSQGRQLRLAHARPNTAVMLRESGASSTPRRLGSIVGVSGILDHPLSRMMTVVDTVSRSRGAIARALNTFSAPKGVGNAGRPMHPQPGGQKKQAAPVTTVTTVTPESPGIPARGWF
jgi:hypothetical protein